MDLVKEKYPNAFRIKLNRENFDSALTNTEQKHRTETALGDYTNYEFTVDNNGTLEELKLKAYELMKKTS